MGIGISQYYIEVATQIKERVIDLTSLAGSGLMRIDYCNAIPAIQGEEENTDERITVTLDTGVTVEEAANLPRISDFGEGSAYTLISPAATDSDTTSTIDIDLSDFCTIPPDVEISSVPCRIFYHSIAGCATRNAAADGSISVQISVQVYDNVAEDYVDVASYDISDSIIESSGFDVEEWDEYTHLNYFAPAEGGTFRPTRFTNKMRISIRLVMSECSAGAQLKFHLLEFPIYGELVRGSYTGAV